MLRTNSISRTPMWNTVTVLCSCRAGLVGLAFTILSVSLAQADYGPRTTVGTSYEQTSTTTSTKWHQSRQLQRHGLLLRLVSAGAKPEAADCAARDVYRDQHRRRSPIRTALDPDGTKPLAPARSSLACQYDRQLMGGEQPSHASVQVRRTPSGIPREQRSQRLDCRMPHLRPASAVACGCPRGTVGAGVNSNPPLHYPHGRASP
jgi:hypothetical protein